MEYTEKEINTVKEICKKLGDFRKEILLIDYINNKAKFFEIMKNFRRYLVIIDQGRNYEIFYHSENYRCFQDFFTKINNYYSRSLEIMQSLFVITEGIHNFNSFSEIIDKDLIMDSFERKTKELDLIDFKEVKNFVLTGSGAFPETLLYIYENTDIENILGLENNHEAIYMAGEMINGLGLKNVSLNHINATKYNYKETDVVSIPLFVHKKDEIINQIIKTGKKGVQILVRSPKGFLNLICSGISNNITSEAIMVSKKDISSNYVNEEIIKFIK